jgi:hypothetical protein
MIEGKNPQKPLVRNTSTAKALYFKCTSEPWPSITGPLSALIMKAATARSKTPTYFINRSLYFKNIQDKGKTRTKAAIIDPAEPIAESLPPRCPALPASCDVRVRLSG